MAWNSQTKLFGLPLVSVGFCAEGIIALGFCGRGVICITQFGYGIITITQFGVGLISLTQFGIGIFIAGQFVLGIINAIGQAAIGFIAIGYNGALGYYSVTLNRSEMNFIGSIQFLYNQALADPKPLLIWLFIWVMIFFYFKDKIRLLVFIKKDK